MPLLRFAKPMIVTSPTESVRTRSPLPISPSWQQVMKEAVRNGAELCRLVGVPLELADDAAARDFPVFAPRGYIARMRFGDAADPLLRQVLPLKAETDAVPGFSIDPVSDNRAKLAPGLLQKYPGRVLMVTTGVCAIHCRYCFRRHFGYSESPRSLADWEPSIAEIESDPSVHEVILSGGDPLTLVDRQLAALVERLAEIPHLRRLRIHTRLPIMIPERVTDELLRWLRGTRLTPIMVIHANHAAELDDAVAMAIGRLVDSGVPLLNQAVLLRGVNDGTDSLVALSERLVEMRVMPYYLHQLDRVAGAAHFEVPVAEGLRLIEEMRSRLPGYAVPRYVAEIAGETSKHVLA
jgi:EF-P beta-lysylation protein EpmB